MTLHLIEDIYPLSPMQQAMLLAELRHPEQKVYFKQLRCTLSGAPDVEALKESWRQVVQRHPVLRTVIVWDKVDDPVQVVYRQVELPIVEHDWRALGGEEAESRFAAFLESDLDRGWDLSKAPLLRLALFRMEEDTYRFVWSYHHILLDGWSVPLIFNEVLSLYEALRNRRAPDLAPVRPFRDYISWLGEQSTDAAESFWREYLRGFDTPVRLGIENGTAPADGGGTRRELRAKFSAGLGARLETWARRHRLTLNTVVQGVWALLVSRYSATRDVVFGTTVSGRPADLQGVGSMPGLFINTLPVRLIADSGKPLVGWLLELQDQYAKLRSYEHSPLGQILRWSEVAKGDPLFTTLLVFENYPLEGPGSAGAPAEGGISIRDVRSLERTEFPLTLEIAKRAELMLLLSYDDGIFSPTAVERLARHIETLLEGVAAAGPHTRLRDLPMLSGTERRQLSDWNATHTAYGESVGLDRAIAEQTARTPDAVAVEFDDRCLSYRELDARARELAHRLQRWGVGPESLVGVAAERSLELVVALVGVLKTGAAYVPLDPSYPRERLSNMIEDARIEVLLTQSWLASRLPASPWPGRVVYLDSERSAAAMSHTATLRGARPDGLAYTIFTSGSTGRPKGAMNSHRGIWNRLRWMQEKYGLESSDRVLQKTPFSFDVSVWEFFWPLLVGSRLVMARPEGHRDPGYLADVIRERKITTLHFVPSMLQAFLEHPDADRCRSVRRVICSGEALPYEVERRFFARLGSSQLHNLYGPTEAAVDVTFWPCDPHNEGPGVPIGHPIANTRIHLLDPTYEPVPVGVAGELHIGGVGVARGYLGRPRLTAEKFVPDALADEPGSRLYRTGDLARYREDGAVEFLGRIDHQVKLRGLRIELGEIEATLLSHPEVREVVVTARSESSADQLLVAYLVTSSGASSQAAKLRTWLGEKLPDYMVPAAFVDLDELPLSPNGKVDRKSLPAPDFGGGSPERTLGGPLNPIEEAIAGVWSELLRIDRRLRRDESFFELGGHSLMATRLLSRLRTTFQVELTMAELFDAPTLGQMGDTVAAALAGGAAVEATPITRVDRRQPIPLSFAQQRLWFLDQLEPGSATYIVPTAVRIHGALDVAALVSSAGEVVRRHESLRTVFRESRGEVTQVIQPAGAIEVPRIDLSALPEAVRTNELRRLAHEEARRGFDLARGPLYRCRLVGLAPGDHALLWTMHHIIADGWARGVLIAELATLYEAFHERRPSPLPELVIQYADFSFWQRRHLTGDVLARQRSYWMEQLSDAPRYLDLPTDRPRPHQRSFRGSHHEFQLSRELSEALGSASRRQGVTPFMMLLAVWNVVLWKWSGQDDVVVGSNIANRNRAEIEGLIGFFINLLPLRTKLSGEMSFRQLLAATRETTLGAYSHQDLPFDLLIHELRHEREADRMPLVQAVFNYETAEPRQAGLADLRLEPLDTGNESVKFDLVLTVSQGQESLKGALMYDTGLFNAPTVARLVRHLEICLARALRDGEVKLDELVNDISSDEKKEAAAARGRLRDLRRKKFRTKPKKLMAQA